MIGASYLTGTNLLVQMVAMVADPIFEFGTFPSAPLVILSTIRTAVLTRLLCVN